MTRGVVATYVVLFRLTRAQRRGRAPRGGSYVTCRAATPVTRRQPAGTVSMSSPR